MTRQRTLLAGSTPGPRYLAVDYPGAFKNTVRVVYQAPRACRTRAALEQVAIPAFYRFAGTWYLWEPDEEGKRQKVSNTGWLEEVPMASKGPPLLPSILDSITKAAGAEPGEGSI